MTDAQVLAAALERWGSKQAIAKVLNIAPQTVSDWGKVRKKLDKEYVVPIPRAHRRALMLLLGLPEDVPAVEHEQWLRPEWRQAHAVPKAIRQIERLYLKTGGGRSKDWDALMSVLNLVVPWGDKDWRELYHSLEDNGGADEGEP